MLDPQLMIGNKDHENTGDVMALIARRKVEISTKEINSVRKAFPEGFLFCCLQGICFLFSWYPLCIANIKQIKNSG